MKVAEPQPSRRGRSLPASPIRRLAPLAAAAEARGLHVHYLNIGQPDLAPPPDVVAAMDQASNVRLSYAPSRGLPDTVNAWVGYYRNAGIEIEPSDVLVTAGASEALSLAFLLSCDPGDDVLVPEPFYAPYRGVASIYGARIVPVPLGSGFAPPSIDAFQRALTPRTRAILICSPNNPTGTVYTREDLIALGSFAREHGLFLLSDETYREIVFNGPAAPSALSIPELEATAIVIDSLSKRFNVCGVRIGSLVSRNEAIMSAALELAELRLAVPAVEQHAASAALNTPAEYLHDLVSTYDRRVSAVVDGLAGAPGVEARKPDGAFYVAARLPIESAERFAAWLLSEFSVDRETVMVTPMSDFYATPGRGLNEIRIACIVSEQELARASRILCLGLEQYQQSRT
ncbi:MAG: pyridoxal phosphate-dependent aminotransferase [Nitrolancea sp.]